MKDPVVHALIVGAGSGSRFGEQIPKQYVPIDLNVPVDENGIHTSFTAFGYCALQYSVLALARHNKIKNCTLVVAKNDDRAAVLEFALPVRLVVGGVERWQSVAYGVQKIAQNAHKDDLVLIHDAARPCLELKDLTAVIDAASSEPYGAILAVPVADTLKSSALSDNIPYVGHTVPRQGIWQVQTPQVYRLGNLLKVIDFIRKNQRPVKRKFVPLKSSSPSNNLFIDNPLINSKLDDYNPLYASKSGGIRLKKIPPLSITDEAMGFEALGLPVRLVMGSASNIKLTYPSDMKMIRLLLSARHR